MYIVPTRFFLAILFALLLVACGGNAAPSPDNANIPTAIAESAGVTISPTNTMVAAAVSEAPIWKYVNSGWVSLRGKGEVGDFTSELRAFVITNEEEMDAFQDGTSMKRSYGTTASLGRVDFSDSILLAAYYLWRPLQGDPLSVVGLSLDGDRADIRLELEESPQGKEYPYLLAPMTMVAVDRSHFPSGAPVNFVFRLNGGPHATVVATVK